MQITVAFVAMALFAHSLAAPIERSTAAFTVRSITDPDDCLPTRRQGPLLGLDAQADTTIKGNNDDDANADVDADVKLCLLFGNCNDGKDGNAKDNNVHTKSSPSSSDPTNKPNGSATVKPSTVPKKEPKFSPVNHKGNDKPDNNDKPSPKEHKDNVGNSANGHHKPGRQQSTAGGHKTQHGNNDSHGSQGPAKNSGNSKHPGKTGKGPNGSNTKQGSKGNKNSDGSANRKPEGGLSTVKPSSDGDKDSSATKGNRVQSGSGGDAKGGNGGSANGGSADCSTSGSLIGINALNIGSCNGGSGGNASGGSAAGGAGGLSSLFRREYNRGDATGGKGGSANGGDANSPTKGGLLGGSLANVGSNNGGDGGDASGGDAFGGSAVGGGQRASTGILSNNNIVAALDLFRRRDGPHSKSTTTVATEALNDSNAGAALNRRQQVEAIKTGILNHNDALASIKTRQNYDSAEDVAAKSLDSKDKTAKFGRRQEAPHEGAQDFGAESLQDGDDALEPSHRRGLGNTVGVQGPINTATAAGNGNGVAAFLFPARDGLAENPFDTSQDFNSGSNKGPQTGSPDLV